MKGSVFLLSLLSFLLFGCTQNPPIKNPQYTESNIPKAKKIYVPYFRQGHAQCFPACLFMIFKFYGEEISFQEIDDWIRGARGTTRQAAEQFCNMKKFNTYVFYDWKGDKIKYFLAQGYPLVAWVDKKGFGMAPHVIILTGYDDEKQVFYINDPATNDKEISYKNFKEIRSLVEGERNYTLLIWPSSPETKVPHIVTEILTLTTPPAGAEIVSKPQWTEGDTWVYQSGKGKFIWEVEKIDSSGIILKQGRSRNYYDSDFGFIKKTLGEKLIFENNPPNKGSFSFPLWVGKKWRNEFAQKNLEKGMIYNFIELFEVKGWEDVQTPAGVFKALKIEGYQENLDIRGSWTYTFWYSPEVKNYIKSSSKDLKSLNWILADFNLKKIETQTPETTSRETVKSKVEKSKKP